MMPNSKRFRARRILGAAICLLLAAQLRSAAFVSAQPQISRSADVAQTTPAPAPLSNTGTGVDSDDPDIATCANGSVHVVWAEGELGDKEIWYQHRDPIAGWSEPEPAFIQTPLWGKGSRPAIAAEDRDDGGCTVHLVWKKFWQDYDEIFYAFNEGNGFELPENVSGCIPPCTRRNSEMPDIVIMPDEGTPHVVWVEGSDFKIYEGWPNPGLPWSKVEIIRASGLRPALAVDREALLHLTWMGWSSQQSRTAPPSVRYRSQEEQSGQSDPEWIGVDELISNDNSPARVPAIAVSDALVGIAWQETIDDDADVLFTWRPLPDDPSEPFRRRSNLSASDASSLEPALATDDLGTFYAVWDQGKDVDAVVARRWPGKGEWWRDQEVSNGGTDVGQPAIAASTDGNSIYAVWAQQDGPDDKLDIYFSKIDFRTYYFHLALISKEYDPDGGSP